MINVRDLMVGNLINTRDGVVEVGKVHRDSVGDKWGGIYFDDEIDGIEVTEEMLRNIGFKEDITAGEPMPFWRYWDKDWSFKLEVFGDSWCNSDKKFVLHVDNGDCCALGCGEFTYLHELQNLVRCITGRSLPIEKDMLYGLDD